LRNQREYEILFQDYRSIVNYLSYTNCISTFQDSNEIIIANFEDYDVTKGTISGSTINATHLSLWSSVYIQSYTSSILLLLPIDNFTGIYSIHLSKPLNGSKLRCMVTRTDEGLVDYLIVRRAYDNKTFDSFNVRVLPALTKQLFKNKFERICFCFANNIITIDSFDRRNQFYNKWNNCTFFY